MAEARKIAQTDFQIKVPTQFEDKDTEIITQQSPNPSDYARIMKGQTVTVQTQEKEKTGSKTDDKTEANNNDDEDKNKGEEK